MDAIPKILIAFDLCNDYREESNQVPVEVRNAIRLISNKQTAQIFLVGCGIEEHLGDSYSKLENEANANRKRFCKILEGRLQSIADNLITKGYRVTTTIISTHHPFAQVAQLSEEFDADLVVQHVNARDASKLRDAAYGSWQLARVCRRPLLFVRDSDWQESPVIVTTSDSMPSYYSTTQGGSLSLYVTCHVKMKLRENLQVVHAYSEFPWPFGNAKLLNKFLKRQHKKAFVELLAPFRVASEAVHLLDQVPQYALSHYNEKLKPDIVIMNSDSRSRFIDAIIGNPTKGMLDYLQTDLLIIRRNYLNENAKKSIKNHFEQTCSGKMSLSER
ncbi:MAG: hypothetical protein COB36_09775 [Alphaproteobacteria bacterium]|nr:MAG: hypothetical protein COB36_09775 [Alphaproteobacteria bacterium]